MTASQATRAHCEHGFSLIEVIAALAIIALGLAAFSQAMCGL